MSVPGRRTAAGARATASDHRLGRGFSSKAFAEGLARAGIAYEHWPALGNPDAIRSLWAVDMARGAAAYRAFVLDQRRDILEALGREVGRNRIALLCVEGDPGTCHRGILADILREQIPGLTVEHLGRRTT